MKHHRIIKLLGCGLVIAALAAPLPAGAGWLNNVIEGAAKSATEKVVNRGANEASDAAYDKAKKEITGTGQPNGTPAAGHAPAQTAKQHLDLALRALQSMPQGERRDAAVKMVSRALYEVEAILER